MARSYGELFAGYAENPRGYLERTFEEVGGYDELVVLSEIRVVSFCEHHMLPVLTAEIAEAIQDVLKPKGVAVVIEAEHSCMTLRGVWSPGA